MNYLPIIKDYGDSLTSAQVFSTFKKEVVSFFIRDIQGFEVISDLNIDVFERDFTEPSGFSKYKIGDQSIDPIYDNQPRTLPFKIFQKYKKLTTPAIFKIRIYAIAKVSEKDLEFIFDQYRACSDTFYSRALNREFEIGDGDDSGAVTIGKRGKGFYVDIWVRSLC